MNSRDNIEWKLVESGQPASSGLASGIALILNQGTKYNEMLSNNNFILITDNLNLQTLAPLIINCAGVIFTTGNVLSHPAFVARQLGIPAIICSGRVSIILKSGERIFIDGSTGEVWAKRGEAN